MNASVSSSSESSRRMRVSRAGILFLIYLLAASTALFFFLLRPGIDKNPRATFPNMVHGVAHKPFVYRALIPGSVRLISRISPEGLKNRVRSWPYGKRLVGILAWDERYLYEYVIGTLLMLSCFMGFAYCMRFLLTFYYHYPGFVSTLVPAGVLGVLPIIFCHNNYYASYPYDPCTVFLFSLAIVFIATRKHVLFYLVFLLATVNKETSLLLIALFVLHESKTKTISKYWVHLMGLCFCWAVVKLTLTLIFWHNPGSIVEFTLIDHNLRMPVEHPLGFFYALAVFLLSAWLIKFRWKERPVFLRQGLMVTLMPLVVIGMFVGYLDELRIYSETLPFVVLLMAPSLIDIFDNARESK